MHANNYMLLCILFKTLYAVFDLYQEEKINHLGDYGFNNTSAKLFAFLRVNETSENHVSLCFHSYKVNE